MLCRPLPPLILALALLGASGLPLAGCDSAPTTCPSGQIESIDFAVGTGAQATTSNRVRITYDGQLEDGREVTTGTNVVVDLSRTDLSPPGFSQGIVGMRAGGRRRFTLPPNLGFGPTGLPGIVPACARLRFNIELHEILPPACGNAGDVLTDDVLIGEGPEATPAGIVTVRYVLKLAGGTVVRRVEGEGERVSLSTMPAGFRMGVGGDGTAIAPMRVGGRRLILVPPNHAYGIPGLPPSIPSCAALTYENVELLGVG